MFDLLIRGATVFDGSGAAPLTADVAIRDGHIDEMSRTADGARRVVDALKSNLIESRLISRPNSCVDRLRTFSTEYERPSPKGEGFGLRLKSVIVDLPVD